MAWRVRAVAVKAQEPPGWLRWTLRASTEDLETMVTADTTPDGRVYDSQSDEYVHTSGDEELDYEVQQHILDTLALRTVSQSLDAIDRERWGRVQQPSDRNRWAA
jgi:hypothetical protein